jgi:hypothetical protein
MREVRNWLGIGAAMVLGVHALGAEAWASAATPIVPEIGPASISAGLAVLAGGVLLLRTRRRSK